MTEEQIEAEAVRRFAWCFPSHSDMEDEIRKASGKPKRDWEPTRVKARSQVLTDNKEIT